MGHLNRECVSNMQIPIGFGRETRDDFFASAGSEFLVDEVANEI